MKSALLALTALSHFFDHAFATEKAGSKSKFDWSSLSAAEDLKYKPCYDKFECARLYVPLDWNNSSSSNNVSLAIVRLPAKVPESDPDHGGTIITNPGKIPSLPSYLRMCVLRLL